MPIYDKIAADLLLEGEPLGGDRLKALLAVAEGGGEPCEECGCTYFHNDNGWLTCDYCGHPALELDCIDLGD